LETIIDIPRKLNLAKTLKFYNGNDTDEIENVQYEQNVNEYYIEQI